MLDSKKIILLVALLALVGIGYFYFGKGAPIDAHIVDETTESNTPESASLNNTNNPEVNTTEENNIPVASEYDFNDEYFAAMSLAKCGIDLELHDKKKELIDTNQFTDAQLKALSVIEERCLSWFDYYEQLSEERKLELQALSEEESKRQSGIVIYEYDEKHANEMLKLLKDGTDWNTGGLALLYLLAHDYKFRERIGEIMGTDSTLFLEAHMSDLMGIHMCESGADCSSNGEMMLNLCLSDPTACNQSFNSLISNSLTPNQLSDIYDAYAVILRILRGEIPYPA
ncbi:hypothetical protein [Marinicella sp. W31]|uniref:hypothetical protein n=1 Tax=Marinicella sp. W31 TaxID=3023713 RepID=UPI0037565FD9